MSIEKTILTVFEEGGELFIRARDEKQCESLRVTAFNIRRRMPALVQKEVGIQKYVEDGKFFIRIYKYDVDDETWVRDPETGQLIPAQQANLLHTTDPSILRVIELMQKDGKTQEEIKEVIRDLT